MKQVIETLQKRIDDLENRSRRSNLIVYGLAEQEGETSESLEQAVNEGIIKEKLELEPVAIERIHRLGNAQPNKVRPVIFKLLDSRQKNGILKNGYKLKNSGLSIGEDFSRKIREVRKRLWESAKENRQKHEKVSLAFDKLYINGQAFVWNNEKNDKVLLRQKKDDTKGRPYTRQGTKLKK